ncbi:hypothetical protein BB559_003482 [Furculomyces boomerangus]|uniref:Uncharacterized protein n=1 Tax=Furculomyces boomerangus TaxID=61424 RepID=A0A2T9YL46_9FUNG|nr:hypothetical protein BB559_003482 [Furculomyces boomerangus]
MLGKTIRRTSSKGERSLTDAKRCKLSDLFIRDTDSQTSTCSSFQKAQEPENDDSESTSIFVGDSSHPKVVRKGYPKYGKGLGLNSARYNPYENSRVDEVRKLSRNFSMLVLENAQENSTEKDHKLHETTLKDISKMDVAEENKIKLEKNPNHMDKNLNKNVKIPNITKTVDKTGVKGMLSTRSRIAVCKTTIKFPQQQRVDENQKENSMDASRLRGHTCTSVDIKFEGENQVYENYIKLQATSPLGLIPIPESQLKMLKDKRSVLPVLKNREKANHHGLYWYNTEIGGVYKIDPALRNDNSGTKAIEPNMYSSSIGRPRFYTQVETSTYNGKYVYCRGALATEAKVEKYCGEKIIVGCIPDEVKWGDIDLKDQDVKRVVFDTVDELIRKESKTKEDIKKEKSIIGYINPKKTKKDTVAESDNEHINFPDYGTKEGTFSDINSRKNMVIRSKRNNRRVSSNKVVFYHDLAVPVGVERRFYKRECTRKIEELRKLKKLVILNSVKLDNIVSSKETEKGLEKSVKRIVDEIRKHYVKQNTKTT